MRGTPGAEVVGQAYFAFYLLAMGQGKPRSPLELARLVAGAGFQRPRLVPTRQPLQSQLLVARR